MEVVYRCAGVAVVGALLSLVTKKHSGEFGVLLTISVVLVLFTMVLGLVQPLLSFVRSLQETAELGEGLMGPVIKTLAMGILTETGKGIAEEAGEKTVGSVLALAGSIGGLYVLLPLLQGMLDLLETLL